MDFLTFSNVLLLGATFGIVVGAMVAVHLVLKMIERREVEKRAEQARLRARARQSNQNHLPDSFPEINNDSYHIVEIDNLHTGYDTLSTIQKDTIQKLTDERNLVLK